MKASELAKQYGTTIAEVSRVTGKDRKTLTRWYTDSPVLFRIVCAGVARLNDE